MSLLAAGKIYDLIKDFFLADPTVLITAGDMSGNLTGTVLELNGAKSVGLRIHASSDTHVGTLVVEISNRKQNWTAISYSLSSDGTIVSSLSAESGSPFTHYIQITDCAAQWLRVRYTASSGAGALHVNALLKM